MNGEVPLDSKDENDKSTMKLKDIYATNEEYCKWEYENLVLRKALIKKKDLQRAFVSLNEQVSTSSHLGREQWQGSIAQDIVKKKLKSGEDFTTRDLYDDHEEINECFPPNVFRDKVLQETRTKKE